jgi:hypothetical protein
MSNQLFFTAALWAPSFAYASDPSADLSVQTPANGNESMMIGVPIGILIGVLSGLMTYLFLFDAGKRSKPRRPWLRWLLGGKSPVSGFRVAAKVSSLPPFWLGGSWLTSCLNGHIDYWIVEYVSSLALTYCLIILPAIVRLAVAYWRKWAMLEHKAVARLRPKPDSCNLWAAGNPEG